MMIGAVIPLMIGLLKTLTKQRTLVLKKDVKDSTTYEVNTEPKSGYRAGSVYSCNYREPKIL